MKNHPKIIILQPNYCTPTAVLENNKLVHDIYSPRVNNCLKKDQHLMQTRRCFCSRPETNIPPPGTCYCSKSTEKFGFQYRVVNNYDVQSDHKIGGDHQRSSFCHHEPETQNRKSTQTKSNFRHSKKGKNEKVSEDSDVKTFTNNLSIKESIRRRKVQTIKRNKLDKTKLSSNFETAKQLPSARDNQFKRTKSTSKDKMATKFFGSSNNQDNTKILNPDLSVIIIQY